MKSIRNKCIINEDMYMNFYYKKFKPQRIASFISMIMIILTIAFSLFVRIKTSFNNTHILILLFILLLILLFFYIYFSGVYAAIQYNKNPNKHAIFEFVFNENNFTITNNKETATYFYSDIKNTKLYNDFLIIAFKKTNFVLRVEDFENGTADDVIKIIKGAKDEE